MCRTGEATETEADQRCRVLGQEGGGEGRLTGTGVILGDERVLESDGGDGCTNLRVYQTPLNYILLNGEFYCM